MIHPRRIPACHCVRLISAFLLVIFLGPGCAREPAASQDNKQIGVPTLPVVEPPPPPPPAPLPSHPPPAPIPITNVKAAPRKSDRDNERKPVDVSATTKPESKGTQLPDPELRLEFKEVLVKLFPHKRFSLSKAEIDELLTVWLAVDDRDLTAEDSAVFERLLGVSIFEFYELGMSPK